MMLHGPAHAPSSALSLALQRPPERLQRACACDQETEPSAKCSACRDGDTRLRRQGTGRTESLAVPAIVGSVLASPGQPLDLATRLLFESRFGHDFGRVRVHSDSRAADSASAVDAEAYTVGPHVVFAAGRYAPGSERGRSLLAHELVHTIQQGAGPHPVPARVGDAHDHSEREAEALAEQALRGAPAAVGGPFSAERVRGASSHALARQQTAWPAWHQEALAEIARVAGKSDGTTADADFALLEPWLCALTPGRARSLVRRLGPSAAGLRAGTDDFAVYVRNKFPTKYLTLMRILFEIAAGTIPEECKKEEEDGNGDGKDGDGDRREGDGGGPTPPGCPTACKALKSMRNSVKHLCELAGEDSDRCKEARKKLEENEARVRQKGCGCVKPVMPNV
jgi:Domain of unknown function (DUF4157)